MLSQRDILDNVKEGSICITDFSQNNLGHCTYEVRLGIFYYRKIQGRFVGFKCVSTAKELSDQKTDFKRTMEIQEGKPGFILAPKETVLCHTSDCIGVAKGLCFTFTPHQRVISSMLAIAPQIIQPGPAQRICLSVYNPTDTPVPFFCGSVIGHVHFTRLGYEMSFFQEKVTIEKWNPNKMLPENARSNTNIEIEQDSGELTFGQDKDKTVKKINETEDALNKKKVRKTIPLPQPKRDENGKIIIPDILKSVETCERKQDAEYIVVKKIEMIDDKGQTIEKEIKDYVVPKPKDEIKYDATQI